jgi:gliding motility-associated-like protein
VTVTYANPPSTGNLVVNGQPFVITTSPQTVTLTGLTSDGLSLDITANFDANTNCSLTITDLFTASVDCTPTPCEISDITAGIQTLCDPLTNTYSQEVTVTYANPPSTGNLVVNGQPFVITTSPQTVTLTGLTSNGLSVDVTANFDANTSCSLTINDLFTSVNSCEIECGELYIPNAFSPNGDQNNDSYMIQINELCVESMNLSIYDRWGERVFVSEDIEITWDGTFRDKLSENGVYVYKLIIKISDEDESLMKTGNINLIR